jgi:hypothetical protein
LCIILAASQTSVQSSQGMERDRVTRPPPYNDVEEFLPPSSSGNTLLPPDDAIEMNKILGKMIFSNLKNNLCGVRDRTNNNTYISLSNVVKGN